MNHHFRASVEQGGRDEIYPDGCFTHGHKNQIRIVNSGDENIMELK